MSILRPVSDPEPRASSPRTTTAAPARSPARRSRDRRTLEIVLRENERRDQHQRSGGGPFRTDARVAEPSRDQTAISARDAAFKNR